MIKPYRPTMAGSMNAAVSGLTPPPRCHVVKGHRSIPDPLLIAPANSKGSEQEEVIAERRLRARSRVLRCARHPEGFPLFSRAHAFPGTRRRSRVVSLRLVLALWAAAIYAIYWLGYLRGPL